MATIHWSEPSQWTWLTHQGWFICSKHNKWPSQAAYSYEPHKQMNFHCQCQFFFPQMSNCVLLMINILIIGRSIGMDHVKSSLVHDFFHIQSIKMIPLHKFKEVIPDVQYKKCKNKIKRTWYNFTQEVFFEYMYKVNFLNLFADEFHYLKQLHLILS